MWKNKTDQPAPQRAGPLALYFTLQKPRRNPRQAASSSAHQPEAPARVLCRCLRTRRTLARASG